ncbi:MAG: DNA polymerase Y family protein, partial [Deltaproteobacteria bacterium]|nr:DNA polymerase Y family protein [Deltaproteobacteria bacterium]
MKAMRRTLPREYACIFAPALPLQALVRSEPDLADRPLATVAGEGTRAAVSHASRAAHDAGVRPGMTPTQARSIAPATVLRAVPAPVVEAAASALLDVGLAHSPAVQVFAPGAVALDVSGTERAPHSREALACVIQSAAARTGLRVRVAIASGPRIALIAARAVPEVTVLPRGGEAAFLAPLPIRALDPPQDLGNVLDRLGVRTIGALAALDRRGIGIRLGPEAFALHRLARGEDGTRLEPVAAAETFEEVTALDYSLDNAEPLIFLVAAALERLTARLEARLVAPAAVRVALDLDPRGVHTVFVTLPAPSSDVRSLAGLIRLALDERPPPEPVRGLRVQAVPGARVPVQGHLFGPPMPEPSRLATLVTRLAALAGTDRVGAPAVADERGPDPAAVRPFDPPAIEEERARGAAAAARAVL